MNREMSQILFELQSSFQVTVEKKYTYQGYLQVMRHQRTKLFPHQRVVKTNNLRMRVLDNVSHMSFRVIYRVRWSIRVNFFKKLVARILCQRTSRCVNFALRYWI